MTFMRDKMTENAHRSLASVLGLEAGEEVLVVTDDARESIGRAFVDGAERLGARVELFRLAEGSRPLAHIPEDLSPLIERAAVAVNCFTALPEETPFRVALIRAEASGARRVGHAPGITEAMMAEGPMDVDFGAMKQRAMEMISSLRHASYVRITAPSGTDLTLYIEGRRFDSDVEIEPGGCGNLPCGEVWCAPIETLGEGLLVCDGSIGDLGPPPAPVTIELEGGRAVSVDCDDPTFKDRVVELLNIDEEARVIGEFGIGINPGARLTGNMLEDEKAFRTAHVAFGNNEEMPGGRNRSRTHRDFLFKEPTITVHKIDGSAVRVVEDGLASC